MSGTTIIDTRKVKLRPLSFTTLEVALADAQRCVTAHEAGKLKQNGNWTIGQAIAHLAWWAESAFEDKGPKPPLFIRLIGPYMKKSMLSKSLQQGFRLPGAKEGTYGTEEMEPRAALARLQAAYAAMRSKPLPIKHPVFGDFTSHDWINLHSRHAALHLGYFEPQE